MRRHADPPAFSTLLNRYSRMVAAKLELGVQSTAQAARLTAAAGIALSAHHAAQAAVQYSGVVDLRVVVAAAGEFSAASFAIDGLADFGVSAAWFSSYNGSGARQVGFGTTGSVNQYPTPGPRGEQIAFSYGGSGAPQPDMMSPGEIIGSELPWFAPAIHPPNPNKTLVQGNNYAGYDPGNNWPNPAYPYSYVSSNPNATQSTTTGLAAIRFNTVNNDGISKHYGWVRLRIENGPPSGFTDAAQPSGVTVVDWAYNTVPNQPIGAGDLEVNLDPGDFNGDDIVDGKDFLLWNRGLSPAAYSATDLSDWETNYAVDPDLAASNVGAVPEPGAAATLSLGLLATGIRGVRRHRREVEGRGERGGGEG